MAFDAAWESVFKSQQWGRYPTEDIVRLVLSRFPKAADRLGKRALDVGCGGGANTWLLAREGFKTAGIDGSISAIQQAEALLKQGGETAEFRVGDFVHLDFPNSTFDLVLD